MSKRVLTVFAEGFEEIEAVTPVDLLRRAGIEVDTAGITGIDITGSHGISIIADYSIDEIEDVYDGIIIPGGIPGSVNIAGSDEVLDLIRKMNAEGRLIASICAAPALVLYKAGVLNGKKATCYPGYEKEFKKGVEFSDEKVVVDENIITSRGAGCAAEFSHAVIEYLAGRETADKVLSSILYR